MTLPTRHLHIRFSTELIATLDGVCKQLYIDRSEFIRQAVVEKLRTQTAHALPATSGFNILMTDTQLDEISDIIVHERYRRQQRRHRSKIAY